MDTKKTIISTGTTQISNNRLSPADGGRPGGGSPRGAVSGITALFASAAIFFAALTAFAPCGAEAAMTSCQHCKKQVDDANSVCPYCLGDMNVPAVSIPPANKGAKKYDPATPSQTTILKAGRGRNSSLASSLAAQAGGAETLVTEQQMRVYLEDTLLKRFHNDHSNQRIKVENVKRDAEESSKFKVIGTAFNAGNRPLNTVGRFIEILDEQPAIMQSYLNHAAKVDINDPTLVSYTITIKIDPLNKAFSQSPKASQPIDFTFVVPPSQSENVTVKILKINADSESVLYNMQNKAGDKVTLSLIAEAGMKVVVMIDEKTVYEKKY